MSKTLLILDLDETLIHSNEELIRGIEPAFTLFNYYYVYKRPFMDEFLEICSQYFELAVWSSATSDYVNRIVRTVFPKDLPLSFVWSRKKCTFGTYPVNHLLDSDVAFDHYQNPRVWFKKLVKAKKKGYSLDRVLMVDNSPEKLFYNYGNAVYVEDFKGNINDQELMFLSKYLPTLHATENVRTVEKRGWKSSVF